MENKSLIYDIAREYEDIEVQHFSGEITYQFRLKNVTKAAAIEKLGFKPK
jgi:hypothetical protein